MTSCQQQAIKTYFLILVWFDAKNIFVGVWKSSKRKSPLGVARA